MKKLIIITLAILLVSGSMAYAEKRLDYNGYIRSAKIYLDLTPKDYKKAAEMLQSAIDFYPNEPPIEAHFILGLIYSDKRLYKEMRDEFNYVVDACANAKEKKAKKACEKGQFEALVDTVLKANWLSQYNTGVNTLKRARSEDSACQTITDEIEKAACDSSTMKTYEEARKDFELSTMILPDSSHGWINIGLVYYSTGRSTEALDAYRKAISINSNDVALLSNIFSIFFNLQEYDSACHYGSMMVELDTIPQSKADVLYNMAFAMNAVGNIDSAVSLLDRVVEITPESIDALYNRGAFKVGSGSPLATRLGVLSDSLEIDEKKYQPIADSLRNELKTVYREAAIYFEKVVDLQPDNMEALDWLGRAYFIIEEWDKSKEFYNKILKVDPENEDAWCQLLLLYLKENNPAKIKEAKKHCSRFK